MSELGYGCTAQFGKDFLGKPGISEEQAVNLVKTALELGITFFDTGFNYGYAEERLGRCLTSIFSEGVYKRESLIIQTKCCETLNSDGSYGVRDYSPDWIKKSVELSLKRLKLDYIDLLALHGAQPQNISDALLNLFDNLKRQKIIRAYGVSGITNDFGKWVCNNKCFDYVMMTYNYTEARRNELIQNLHDNGIGILSGGSLNRSFNTLRKIPRTRNELWYLIRALVHFRGEFKRSKLFDFVKNVDGMTPQQISLAYILGNSHITSASFNTLNTEHLKANVKATDIPLPQNLKERIDGIL